MLVAFDRVDPDAIEIVDRSAQAHGIGDIARARLETRGRRL